MTPERSGSGFEFVLGLEPGLGLELDMPRLARLIGAVVTVPLATEGLFLRHAVFGELRDMTRYDEI